MRHLSLLLFAPLMLRLEGFACRIGHRFVLNNIDVEFPGAQLTCLLGPNGAGKSTLLQSLCKASLHYEGSIIWNGKRADPKDYVSQAGFLGHAIGLFYDMKVYENLLFFQNIYANSFCKGRSGKLDGYLLHLLELAKMEHCLGQSVRSLSRGYQQRLGLIRSVLHKPAMLFLDEPLTALDVEGMAFLRSLLREALQRGSMILAATHTETFFEDHALARRYLFLKEGSLIADIASEHYTQQAKEQIRYLLYQ